MKQKLWRALALACALGAAGGTSQAGTAAAFEGVEVAARQTCKQMTTCRDAVILWCGGYSRADGDNDGIPCENVCRSRREVDAVRRAIGC